MKHANENRRPFVYVNPTPQSVAPLFIVIAAALGAAWLVGSAASWQMTKVNAEKMQFEEIGQ